MEFSLNLFTDLIEISEKTTAYKSNKILKQIKNTTKYNNTQIHAYK